MNYSDQANVWNVCVYLAKLNKLYCGLVYALPPSHRQCSQKGVQMRLFVIALTMIYVQLARMGRDNAVLPGMNFL